jgi:trehalose utilization protein
MSATPTPIRVLVWGENRHEQRDASVAATYPAGMHSTIAEGVREFAGSQVVVSTATLDEAEHGLSEAVLAATDVLVWWGHAAHSDVDDEVVDRVHRHVLSGMGLVVLHSGHWSKIFV